MAMDNQVLVIVMRYVHLASAILAVGGMATLLVCLLPALRLVDETFKESLLRLVHQRFMRLIWLSIIGLTVSGIYNWIRYNGVYSQIKPQGVAWGQILIGVKVMLAAVLFLLVFARASGLIQLKSRTALMINIHLAAVVILLGVILHQYRLAAMLMMGD